MEDAAAAGRAAPPITSLHQRVVSGLRWTVSSQALVRVANLASGVVLARLLVPDDFGVFAVALAAITVLLGVNDVGLILAIVRSDERDAAGLARTAVSIVVTSSVILFVVCIAAAGPFTRAMGSHSSAWPLRVLALVLVVDAITAMPSAFLQRAFRLDRQSIAEVVGLVVSMAVSLALAASGGGAWSLVLGRVGGNVATAALLVVWAPALPRPAFVVHDAKALLRFGVPMAGASLVYFTLLNVDYLVVAHLLGTTELGYYVLAFNLSSWPANVFALAIRRVAVPGFAELAGDRARLRNAFARSLHSLFTATVPVVVLLAVLAGPLVGLLYGSKWSAAVTPLRYLAVVGGTRILLELVENILVVLGRSRTNLAVHLVWLLALVPALVLGGRLGGIAGVAAAHAAVAVGVAIPVFLRSTRHAGVRIGALLTGSWRPVVGVLPAAAGAMLLLTRLDQPAAQIGLVVPTVVLMYAAFGVERDVLRSGVRSLAGRAG